MIFIQRDNTGRVIIDVKLCTGAGMCLPPKFVTGGVIIIVFDLNTVLLLSLLHRVKYNKITYIYIYICI